jgi:hypothetical protein
MLVAEAPARATQTHRAEAAGPAAASRVRLVASYAVADAGERVTILIVNATSRPIVYVRCFRLAHRLDGRWRTITHAHGRRIECSTSATVQPAHSSKRLKVDFYNNLAPGRYRVTLSYQSNSSQHVARTYLTLTVRRCVFPPGAVTVAGDHQAIVSRWLVPTAPYTEYLGCAKSTGQLRVLERLPRAVPYNDNYDNYSVPSVAIAGGDAALGVQYENEHYGDTALTLDVFDLRTGRRIAGRGGSLENCGGDGDFAACGGRLQTVVVNAYGDAAAEFSYLVSCPATLPPSVPGGPCTTEQIEASDSSSLHSIDSVVDPYGGSSTFSNLTLTGQVLRWYRAGVPHSTVLR